MAPMRRRAVPAVVTAMQAIHENKTLDLRVFPP